MELENSPFSPGRRRDSGRAEQLVLSIYTQLSEGTSSLIKDLAPCGPETILQLRQSADPSRSFTEACRILEHLESFSGDGIQKFAKTNKPVPLHMMRLYTECRLLHSLLQLQNSHEDENEDTWLCAVRRLDMAIIISGAPGEGRLDLILDTIELIQSQHLPLADLDTEVSLGSRGTPTLASLSHVVDSVASNPIPRIVLPSFSTFRNEFSSKPFIMPGYIRDWPALNSRPWRSPGYLQQIAGRGRIVPVEVGSDYRAADWGQKLMPWEEFLQGIGLNPNVERAEMDAFSGDNRLKEALYLAQHNLLTQFPALRSDIIVPDYVYASLAAPSTFPRYKPPNNEEQLVINAWLGPAGTVSPAHTDPYFNCYAQVVGRKTVWLSPPRFQEEMYPFSNPHAPHTARTPSEQTSSLNPSWETLLTNTSRVDVFAPSDLEFPLFKAHVFPSALCAVLEPGDLLYIPPGWWHAMRSEDVSFSVSMWF